MLIKDNSGSLKLSVYQVGRKEDKTYAFPFGFSVIPCGVQKLLLTQCSGIAPSLAQNWTQVLKSYMVFSLWSKFLSQDKTKLYFGVNATIWYSRIYFWFCTHGSWLMWPIQRTIRSIISRLTLCKATIKPLIPENKTVNDLYFIGLWWHLCF